MPFKHLRIPDPWLQKQKAMQQVSYALLPLLGAAVYLFGWRALALTAIVLLCGVATEALFVFPAGKPVTSAVLVTCLIFALSLPPTLPFWMAAVGIVVGVALGKMVFGGFGRNVFNPAMVGRCFIYINFPAQMTNTWAEPLAGRLGGLDAWAPPLDAITRATPLTEFKKGVSVPLESLFVGTVPGSLGETSALLIVLGGAYIIIKKFASWRITSACLLGGIAASGILQFSGKLLVAAPLATLLSGSFLFGAVFVATEPVSGAKTPTGQWIYGLAIGALTVLLRGFSNFSEGVMFSVLLMNALVPLLDRMVRALQARKKATA